MPAYTDLLLFLCCIQSLNSSFPLSILRDKGKHRHAPSPSACQLRKAGQFCLPLQHIHFPDHPRSPSTHLSQTKQFFKHQNSPHLCISQPHSTPFYNQRLTKGYTQDFHILPFLTDEPVLYGIFLVTARPCTLYIPIYFPHEDSHPF